MANAHGAGFRQVVLAGDDRRESKAVLSAGALDASAAVARQDGRPDATRAEPVEEFSGAGHESAAVGGLGFVALEDGVGAGPVGLGEPVHRLQNGGAGRQADLAADGIEIERWREERPVQVEDDKFDGHGRAMMPNAEGGVNLRVALAACPPVHRRDHTHWWTSHQCHPHYLAHLAY